MAPQKILVCGGAGFIGSHLVDRLMAEEYEVDVVDDLSSGALSNLVESRNASGRFKFQNISVQSPEFAELVALRRPDIIINLAVFTPSHAHLSGATSSLSATIAVLEAARLGGVSKVVTALPAGLVYGECLARDLPIKEGHMNDSRTSEEVLARAAAELHSVYRDRHGVEFTVLAMSNVYGRRQRVQDGVVAAFCDALEHGKAPIVHGTGKQTRDFVFIDDTVDALVRSLDRAGGLIVNVGSGVATSVLELWSLMGGVASPAPRAATGRPHDIARLSLSPVRARIQLGWSPFTPLAKGLATLRNQA
ncbi:MAG: NAD-dependent epimerase/dehydratase family protein [Ilumatobacteraceae bacterium]